MGEEGEEVLVGSNFTLHILSVQDGRGRWGVAGGVARCVCTEEGEEVVVGPATLPHNVHLLQGRHRGSISSDLLPLHSIVIRI